MKRRNPFGLVVALFITSLVLAMVGFLIRETAGKGIEQLKDMPALAVPFAIAQDPTILQASQNGHEDTETLSKPTEGVLPSQPSDSGVSEEKKGSGSRVPEVLPAEDASEEEVEQPEEVKWQAVEESWFDDALFIGDSRTLGLSQYGRLGKADYFADTGLTVFNALTTALSDENFQKQDLQSLLSSKIYGKIYLMLGINEIGYPFETLLAQYQTVLDTIRSLQPDAKILLCANLHVTRAAAAETPRLEPDNITRLDTAIASLADGENMYFLDVNPEFCDEAGYLREDMTGDGVHPFGTGYALWAQWLMQHGIA